MPSEFPPPVDAEAELPEAIGRYAVLRRIGRGGFSHVYVGKDPATGSLVALKVLREDIDPSVREQARVRFMAEGAIARAIDHPGVVHVRETSARGERPCFIAMDYVEGLSFRVYFDRLRSPEDSDGKPPSRATYYAEIARLGHEVARTMAVAHARGIVHRDLKPDNVLVVMEEGAPHVRILDFGIAKAPADLFSLEGVEVVTRYFTELGTVMGSPPYMAPEQNGQAHGVTGKADVFALGVMLLVTALGLDAEALEQGDERLVLPADFDDLVRGTALPDRMKRLLRSMIEQAPEKRPSMQEVALGLQRAAQSDDRFGAAVEAWVRRRRIPSSSDLLNFALHGQNLPALTEDERSFLAQAPLARLRQLRARISVVVALGLLALSAGAVAATRGVALPLARTAIEAPREQVPTPRVECASPAIEPRASEESANLRASLFDQKQRLDQEAQKAAEQGATIRALSAALTEQKRGREQAQKQLEQLENRAEKADRALGECRAEADRSGQVLAECRRDLEVHLGQLAESAERLRLCTRSLREQSERGRSSGAIDGDGAISEPKQPVPGG